MIPVELIKILGIWYSDSVSLYFMVPITTTLSSVTLYAKVIISHHTTLTPHFGFGVFIFNLMFYWAKFLHLLIKVVPIGHLHYEVMQNSFHENESYMILPSKND